eukprot:tig00021319_g20206.t1
MESSNNLATSTADLMASAAPNLTASTAPKRLNKEAVKLKLKSGVSALKALWHIDHIYAEQSAKAPTQFQYALIFQDPEPDPKRLLPPGSAVRRYVVARLRRAGLSVVEETHEVPDSPTLHFIKVSGPPKLLASVSAADKRQAAATSRPNKSIEAIKAKKWADLLGGPYPGSGPDVPLTEAEQQQIVRRIMQGIEIDEDGFAIGMETGTAGKRRFDREVPRTLLAWAKEFKFMIEQLPLHNYEAKKTLFTRWVFGRGKYSQGQGAGAGPKKGKEEPQVWTAKSLLETAKALIDFCTLGLLSTPPLGEIRDYFGEKVAFYFAWLHFYTVWLVLPTVLGSILSAVSATSTPSMKWSFFYCSFLMIWGTIFTEGWKRRQAELAFLWGTFQEETADSIESEITGAEESALLVPDPKRRGSVVAGGSTRGRREENVVDLMERAGDLFKRKLGRRVASWALLLTLLAVSMLSFVFCLWFEDVVGKDSWLVRLPAITYVVALTLFRNLYVYAVDLTNKWELHSSIDEANNQHVMKLFTFDFVAWFLGPMYIAFVRQDLHSLEYLVSTTLISKQIIQNVMENVFPLASVMMKGAAAAREQAAAVAAGKKCDDVAVPKAEDLAREAAQESPALVQYRMDPYDDTIADYLEMAVQFGHVVLFAPAFPLSAACALINNVIELRTDAFKLLTGHRRPEANRVDGIGSWLYVLEFMGTAAVVSNVGLIFMFFHPSAWDSASLAGACAGIACVLSVGRLFQAVIVEHVLLAAKLAIAWVVPDVPLWVRFSNAMATEGALAAGSSRHSVSE